MKNKTRFSKNGLLTLLLICIVAIVVSCETKMKKLNQTKWTLEKISTPHGQELIPTAYYTVEIQDDILLVQLDVNKCRVPFKLKDRNNIHIADQAMCSRMCCDSEFALSFLKSLVGAFDVDDSGKGLVLNGKDKIYFRKWSENDVDRKATTDYLKIKRTGCFGTCPIYEMTLYSDGSAEYLGKRFVLKEGKANHAFDRKQILNLIRTAQIIDFSSLHPVYDDEQISDIESVYIEHNGTTIKVRHHKDVPEKLLKLIEDVHQCAIDGGWVGE